MDWNIFKLLIVYCLSVSLVNSQRMLNLPKTKWVSCNVENPSLSSRTPWDHHWITSYNNCGSRCRHNWTIQLECGRCQCGLRTLCLPSQIHSCNYLAWQFRTWTSASKCVSYLIECTPSGIWQKSLLLRRIASSWPITLGWNVANVRWSTAESHWYPRGSVPWSSATCPSAAVLQEPEPTFKSYHWKQRLLK